MRWALLAAAIALAACDDPAPPTVAPTPTPATPAITPRPDRLVRINPTRDPAGDLGPWQSRVVADGDGREIVEATAPADFALVKYRFGSFESPSVEREWAGVERVEVDRPTHFFGLTEALPWEVEGPAGANYQEVFKLYWRPRDVPAAADEWTDDLRWAVLGDPRFHVDDRVRIAAQRTLPDVQEARFIPILLATLLRTDRSRSYDGGRPLAPAAYRIITPSQLSDVERAHEALRRKPQATASDWGLLAACYAAAGRPDRVVALAPTEGLDDYVRGMKDAPFSTVEPVLGLALDGDDETATVALYRLVADKEQVAGGLRAKAMARIERGSIDRMVQAQVRRAFGD